VTRTLDTTRGPTELTSDLRFSGRVRRLVAVSSIMLGVITLLAALSPESTPLSIGLLVSGWILMPTLLDASVTRPRLRYLLALPAMLVTVGLIIVALGMDAWSAATAGWWLLTIGVLFGGGLGSWFWYRWMPVPEQLDDPFAPRRIALIVTHIALVVVGMALIIFG
jgi:hypothetical protein